MKFFIATTLVLLLGAIIFRDHISILLSGLTRSKLTKTEQRNNLAAADVSIKQKWELPDILREVSGIAYIDAQRFACVQDELGTIYIYNVSSEKIEKEIPFTGPGDFEGISLKGDTAYIVRSDAVIFEVDMKTGKSNQYKTFLNASNNIESLVYQPAGNRLLTAGKEPDAQDPAQKRIYSFDLASKTLQNDPVASIKLDDNQLQSAGKSGKKKKSFMPSAIAVHPTQNDLYILDGPRSRLLVADQTGEMKKLYELGNEFYKPEGISFSPAGDLYISNEGKKIPGNILEVTLN